MTTLAGKIISDDALSIARIFKENPNLGITFRSPDRIHPRFKTAIDLLIEVGVAQETPHPERGIKYVIADRALLDTLPKQSMKDMKRVALPTTVD